MGAHTNGTNGTNGTGPVEYVDLELLHEVSVKDVHLPATSLRMKKEVYVRITSEIDGFSYFYGIPDTENAQTLEEQDAWKTWASNLISRAVIAPEMSPAQARRLGSDQQVVINAIQTMIMDGLPTTPDLPESEDGGEGADSFRNDPAQASTKIGENDRDVGTTDPPPPE